MQQNLKLFQDYVLVRPIAQNKTEGGVILPEGVTHTKLRAQVLGVGPGLEWWSGSEYRKQPISHIVPGDVVLYIPMPGEVIQMENGDLLIRAHLVAAKFEGMSATAEELEPELSVSGD